MVTQAQPFLRTPYQPPDDVLAHRERFDRHLVDAYPCLLWNGPDRGSSYGSPRVRLPRRDLSARAFAWLLRAELPEGLIPKPLDCETRLCVAFSHLTLVPAPGFGSARHIAVRDRAIYRMHYGGKGIRGDRTVAELATQFRLSTQRVNQILRAQYELFENDPVAFWRS